MATDRDDVDKALESLEQDVAGRKPEADRTIPPDAPLEELDEQLAQLAKGSGIPAASAVPTTVPAEDSQRGDETTRQVATAASSRPPKQAATAPAQTSLPPPLPPGAKRASKRATPGPMPGVVPPRPESQARPERPITPQGAWKVLQQPGVHADDERGDATDVVPLARPEDDAHDMEMLSEEDLELLDEESVDRPSGEVDSLIHDLLKEDE